MKGVQIHLICGTFVSAFLFALFLNTKDTKEFTKVTMMVNCNLKQYTEV